MEDLNINSCSATIILSADGINDMIYEAVRDEFGEEHASAFPFRYDGPKLDEYEADDEVRRVLSLYRSCN